MKSSRFFSACRRLLFLTALLGVSATLRAQYLYTITDQGLYVAQAIYGPTTNVAGWEVGADSVYSLVKRPGDPGFSQLFPSAYLYVDAAYGINNLNMAVGARDLFYAPDSKAYRADANLGDLIQLDAFTNLNGSDFTQLTRATSILDNGTILGIGTLANNETHVFQLTPITTELSWDANGTTAGIPQGGGTWSLSSGNWTQNTAGTTVAGWTNGAIARFYYNLTPATVTVTEAVSTEGIWAGYTPNGMTIDATGGGSLTFVGQAFVRMAGSPASLAISAPIAGSAGLWVLGSSGGDLHLEGNNTYTGQTRIDYRVSVYARHENALGAAGVGNETLINSGGKLLFDRTLVNGETLLLNGGSVAVVSDNNNQTAREVELAGPVVLQAASSIGGAQPALNSSLTVSGVISEIGGPQNLQTSGVTLTGTNTFTGDLITQSLGVTVSQVTHAGVAGPMGQGNRLVMGVNNEGPEDGAFRYTGSTASTNREVYLEGGGQIEVVQSGTRLTLSGLISGPVGFTKTGTGTLDITGANTYGGLTTVSEGILRVANASGSALGTGSVVVDAGATLTGPGNFSGNLVLSGDYSLGDPTAAALITLGGNVTVNWGGSINFDIGGLTRGTEYDALIITGAFASEGGLRVTFINGFTPVAGNTFDLIDWGSFNQPYSDLDLPTLSGGLAWNTSALLSTGSLSITAIPEPSTYAMLAAVAALGLAVRRRLRGQTVSRNL